MINKNEIIWALIKLIFSRSKLKSILVKYDLDGILEMQERAIKEENYELSAYLEYYIKFKFNPQLPKPKI